MFSQVVLPAGQSLAPTAGQLSDNKLHLKNADKSCLGQGEHLALVYSAEENNFVTGLAHEDL